MLKKILAVLAIAAFAAGSAFAADLREVDPEIQWDGATLSWAVEAGDEVEFYPPLAIPGSIPGERQRELKREGTFRAKPDRTESGRHYLTITSEGDLSVLKNEAWTMWIKPLMQDPGAFDLPAGLHWFTEIEYARGSNEARQLGWAIALTPDAWVSHAAKFNGVLAVAIEARGVPNDRSKKARRTGRGIVSNWQSPTQFSALLDGRNDVVNGGTFSAAEFQQ